MPGAEFVAAAAAAEEVGAAVVLGDRKWDATASRIFSAVARALWASASWPADAAADSAQQVRPPPPPTEPEGEGDSVAGEGAGVRALPVPLTCAAASALPRFGAKPLLQPRFEAPRRAADTDAEADADADAAPARERLPGGGL